MELQIQACHVKTYGVLIHTYGSHSPAWAPRESPSRWNKGKQKFWSPGELETDVVHEWLGRAVPAPLQLHPCLVPAGDGCPACTICGTSMSVLGALGSLSHTAPKD